ncbi:MAG: hypothetical protein KDC38_02310 [Planctomycetes bacterium]|nr:hypothetical protein [Planctomycetota bacterium]
MQTRELSTAVRRRGTPFLLGVATLLVVSAICEPAIHADIVVLTNGNQIRGKIRAEVGDLVEVELPYGMMRFRRRDIREIVKESDGEYLEKTGEKLLQHRDLDKAIEFLRRALAENSQASTRRSLVEALGRRCGEALDAHRFDVAERYLNEGLQLEPSDAALGQRLAALREGRRLMAELESSAERALIEDDVEAAFTSAKALVDEYPERRDAWRERFARVAVRTGHEAVRQERFDRARERYRLALSHDPDLIEYVRVPLGFCEVESVRPLIENGELDSARDHLREAYQVLPGHPAIVYYLALTEEGSGNLARAADLYAILAGPEHETIHGEKHVVELRRAAEAILQESSTIALAKPVRRWSDAEAKPGVLETPNFKIHYSIRERAEEVGRHLEHHLQRLRQKWFRGAQPLRKKVAVYLHPNQDAFRSSASPPPWSSGVTRHEYRLGQCFGHEIHFDASAPQFQSATLPHEICHVLIPSIVGLETRPPLWLDEGLATTEEPEFKQQYYARVVVDALRDGTEFGLAELFSREQYPEAERAALFYAQSNSVTQFLIERMGLREALEFFRALAVGPVEEAVRSESPFRSLDHLEASWKRWHARRVAG